MRWNQPAPEHLDGYRVRVEDAWGGVLSSIETHRACALVTADPSVFYRIEPLDALGRAGAGVLRPGVPAKQLDASPLPLMELLVDEQDLRVMEQALRDQPRFPAELIAGGISRFGTLNFRGVTSLEAPKKSYKFRIEEGPDVDGSGIVALAANFIDKSLFGEIVGRELMVAAGHAPYRAGAARLFLNGAYAGVFTTIEEPDEDYLERIGLDPTGRSYKVNEGLRPREAIESYLRDFENTNEDDWLRRDIIGLVQELDQVPDADFETWFRTNFEVEQVLDWYAAQVYIVNVDFCTQNFLMTRDRLGGKWRILAWDADLLFRFARHRPTTAHRSLPTSTATTTC